MADLDDIEQVLQEAPASAEDAAQASLPASDDSAAPAAPAPSIENSVLADAVNAPASPGEDTNAAESAAQASLPDQSADAQLSDNSDRLADLLSGKVQPNSDDDAKMLQDYLSGVKNDAPGPDGQQFPDAKPVDGSAPAAATPAANPQLAQAIDSAIQNPQVKEYLKQKYGFGSELDDAALKASQEQAARNRNLAMIGRGLDQIGAGFARRAPDSKFWDQRDKDANIPVENLLARRSGIIQNQALTKDQLSNASAQDALQTQLANSDSTSPESKAAQAVYLPILQKAGLDTSILNNASVDTIKQVLQQPLEFADKQKQQELVAQSNADNKRLQMEANNLQRQFNNQFKQQGFSDRQLQQTQNTLNKDPQIVQASKANDSINSSLDTLELAKTNPIAFKANSLDLAKSVLAGAGKLNQTEINQFAGGSAAFQDRLKQIYDQAASGTISPENYDYSKQLLQHLQDKNNQVISQRQQAIGGQLSSRNGADVDTNVQKITGKQSTPSQAAAPQLQSQPAPTAQSDTVQIVTSDGQHLSLPKANLAAAQKRDPNLQVLQ